MKARKTQTALYAMLKIFLPDWFLFHLDKVRRVRIEKLLKW